MQCCHHTHPEFWIGLLLREEFHNHILEIENSDRYEKVQEIVLDSLMELVEVHSLVSVDSGSFFIVILQRKL